MPSFDEAMDLVKEDIAGVPVWAIVGGGAVALLVLSKVLGGNKAGAPGESVSPPPESAGLTRDEYSEISGPQFEGLTSDLAGRFGNLDTVLSGYQSDQRQQFSDLTAGLGQVTAAQQAAFADQRSQTQSIYTQLATGQRTTSDAISKASASQSADIKRIEGKIDALRTAEATRDARQATAFQNIMAMLRSLGGKLPAKAPPLPNQAGQGGAGAGYSSHDPYRALSRGPFDSRRQAA